MLRYIIKNSLPAFIVTGAVFAMGYYTGRNVTFHMFQLMLERMRDEHDREEDAAQQDSEEIHKLREAIDHWKDQFSKQVANSAEWVEKYHQQKELYEKSINP